MGPPGFCPENVIRAAGLGEGVSPSTVSSDSVLASRILPLHLLQVTGQPAASRPLWRPQSQSQCNARVSVAGIGVSALMSCVPGEWWQHGTCKRAFVRTGESLCCSVWAHVRARLGVHAQARVHRCASARECVRGAHSGPRGAGRLRAGSRVDDVEQSVLFLRAPTGGGVQPQTVR